MRVAEPAKSSQQPAMLKPLIPRPSALHCGQVIPSVVSPLTAAAQDAATLTSALQGVVRKLGFDDFTVTVSDTTRPTQDTNMFVWTSLPNDWTRQYDERALVEIDPRPSTVWKTGAPLVWDQRTFRSPAYLELLQTAAAFGECSGIVLPLFHPYHVRGTFALSSSVGLMSTERRREVSSLLGMASVLTAYTYDLFLLRAVEAALPPPVRNAELTHREVECLRFVGKGLSSPDIGKLMGIRERTVEYHVCKTLSKLGATNRREAVAKALAAGLIST